MNFLTTTLLLVIIYYLPAAAFAAPVPTAPARAVPFDTAVSRANLPLSASPNAEISDESATVRLHNLRFTRTEYTEIKRELARKIRVRQSEPLMLQQLLMWAEMARKEIRECGTSWTFNHVPKVDEINAKIEEQCL